MESVLQQDIPMSIGMRGVSKTRRGENSSDLTAGNKQMEVNEMIENSIYAKRAMDFFKKGYNCSQSVFMAFADQFEMDEMTAARLSSSFGGGMGRLREVCGSVTGMFMVAGMLYGYDDPEADKAKAEHYQRIQELAALFTKQNNSIICRDLLGLEKQGPDDYHPSKRTDEYYQTRPCEELVGMAAAYMDEYIKKHPVVRK